MSSAKNVVLGGVKSVTLHDTGCVEISDLSSQVRTYCHVHCIVLMQISFGPGMPIVHILLSKWPCGECTIMFLQLFEAAFHVHVLHMPREMHHLSS